MGMRLGAAAAGLIRLMDQRTLADGQSALAPQSCALPSEHGVPQEKRIRQPVARFGDHDGGREWIDDTSAPAVQFLGAGYGMVSAPPLQDSKPTYHPSRLEFDRVFASGYSTVLEHDQPGAGGAVEDLDNIFRVSRFEIASRLVGDLLAVAERPRHAVDDDLEAFVAVHMIYRALGFER